VGARNRPSRRVFTGDRATAGVVHHDSPRAVGARCVHKWPGKDRRVLGARCDMGDKFLLERITRFEKDSHYSYEVDMQNSTMTMPIAKHRGTFDLEATTNGTQLCWRQYFEPAGWWVPTPMIRWKKRSSMMAPAVDELIKIFRGRWISKR
jgi:hypothetical protein